VFLVERGTFARFTSWGDIRRESTIPTSRKIAESIFALVSRLLSKRAWHDLHIALSRLPARLGRNNFLVCTNYTTPHGRIARFQRTWYDSSIDVTFGGLSLQAPVGTDEVLTQLFGPNYWALPPEESREPAHIRGGLSVKLHGRSWHIRSAD
jgi:hypothetical protein